MFLLSKPDIQTIESFLATCVNDSFSYHDVGGTKISAAPARYIVDHNRIRIGSGQIAFEKAKTAVRAWKMFGMDWVKLFRDETPIAVDNTVAIMVSHFGFYSLNAARIVYVIDEVDGLERYGFAYGTLGAHSEQGEERLSVEYHPEPGEVWYDIYAFSRPASALAKVGFPLARRLQRRFARDSMKAMLAAVSVNSPSP